MRLLLLTQLFQPEPNHIKGLAFARELQRRGHAVQVLTGFPNFPEGAVYPGYAVRPLVREVIEGVPVVRVGHFVSHDASGLRRALSYLTFALSSGVVGAWAVDPPDVIHVYQGPATLMAAAALISRRRGGRIVLDIQDLWPESVTESGMLRMPGGRRVLDRFCRWTYRRADRVVVLSRGYRDRLIALGVPLHNIDVVYNWSPDAEREVGALPAAAAGLVGRPDRFTVVYAGTLGPFQGLRAVVEAASLLRETSPHVRILFVGEGIEEPGLQRRAQALGLDNVVFLPRQPTETVRSILAAADALLIHLIPGGLSGSVIPQKTQAYLAAGRPVVAGIDGEAGDMVESAGAGVRCRPGDPADIARVIANLASRSRDDREAMGRRGREFYSEHLAFSLGCDRMARVFEAAAGAGA